MAETFPWTWAARTIAANTTRFSTQFACASETRFINAGSRSLGTPRVHALMRDPAADSAVAKPRKTAKKTLKDSNRAIQRHRCDQTCCPCSKLRNSTTCHKGTPLRETKFKKIRCVMRVGPSGPAKESCLEMLPSDIFLILAGLLDVRSSVQLSSSCNQVASKTRTRSSWWRAVLHQFVFKELDLAFEDCSIVQNKIPSGAEPRAVLRAMFVNPPLYLCLLSYDQTISREKAVEAIQLATQTSYVGSLWKAVQVGHPAFRSAPDASGVIKGEIMRGTRRQVLDCIKRLEQANPQLRACCELLDYQYREDNEEGGYCSVS